MQPFSVMLALKGQTIPCANLFTVFSYTLSESSAKLNTTKSGASNLFTIPTRFDSISSSGNEVSSSMVSSAATAPSLKKPEVVEDILLPVSQSSGSILFSDSFLRFIIRETYSAGRPV